MVISLSHTLPKALNRIGCHQHQEIIIHTIETERTWKNADEIVEQYAKAKERIITMLNTKYSALLKEPFSLMNWINKNINDEVSYFLSEAGSNTLNHSQFKAPYKFHLWQGEKGFVIGVEQKGNGFPAEKIWKDGIKTNEGNAFTFFQKCQSVIFFDNPHNSRIVFMEYLV